MTHKWQDTETPLKRTIKEKWTEVNYHLICLSTKTHEEVIWFYVSVQESFWMCILYSCKLE